MHELIVELRVQEIPAGMQVAAELDFKRLLTAFLRDNGIDNFSVESESMSNRLVLLVSNLPEHTPNITEDKRGPRTDAPEQAIKGFMQANDVRDSNEMEKRRLSKGEFYFISRRILGRDMAELLAENLPKIVKNISWPKSMRWGNHDISFVRPIDNICAIFDGKAVKFEIDRIESSSSTSGHFFLNNKPFEVTSIVQYKSQMERRNVVLSRSQRKQMIAEGMRETALKIGLKVIENEKLLDEVVGLVEFPYMVLSEFSDHFLDLPKEVLIITMAAHQRYFALENANGDLVNKFIGISNIPDKNGYISEGYAKVLAARFDDAKFYWDSDRKTSLEGCTDALKNIIFQKDLGTVYEKMQRVKALMPMLGKYMVGLNIAHAERAAILAKCDLCSGVVAEFPELQGVMGAYYADYDDENEIVISAIHSQYECQNFIDMGAESLALILADRLDTLVGFLGINQPPTGSKDPYALRRAALSIIRLLRQHAIRLPLAGIINKHLSTFNTSLPEASKTTANLVDFFMNRLKVALRDEGVSHDLVDAVFAKGLDDVVDVANRAKALQSFMNGEDGAALHEAFKRASSILDKESVMGAKIEQSLLKDDAELALFNSFNQVKNKVSISLREENYPSAMQALSTLRKPVDTFFDKVLVMAEEENLRRNRLALLSEMTCLFNEVADFSRIGGGK